MPPKAEEKKNFRSKLVTSQQQQAYTQLIKVHPKNPKNRLKKILERGMECKQHSSQGFASSRTNVQYQQQLPSYIQKKRLQ